MEPLLKPLRFAAKDNFRNLPLIKDLGRTLSLSCESLPVSLAVRALCNRLTGAALEEQKAIVTELLALLDAAPATTPAAEAKTSTAQTMAASSSSVQATSRPRAAPVAQAAPVTASTPSGPRSTGRGRTAPVAQTARAAPSHPNAEKAAAVRTARLRGDDAVDAVKGVGERVRDALATKNLRTVEDLLYFLPRKYEDRSKRVTVREAPIGERVSITGTIRALGAMHTRNGRKMFEMAIGDESGILRLKWFRYNQRQFQSSFQQGMTVVASGTIEAYGGNKQMLHPDLSVVREIEALDDLPPIIPIYSEIEGVHPKTLRRIVANALPAAEALADVLPSGRWQLPPLSEALRVLHEPPADTPLDLLHTGRSPWHDRLILEELLVIQLGLVKRRLLASFEPGVSVESQEPLALAQKLFPFTLTKAQLRVAGDIRKDLASGRPMHRLVQGDVGSGKTAVAFLAALAVIEAKQQAALMAPTELLAEQHFKNALKTLHPLGVRVAFLSSSVRESEAKRILAQVKAGAIDLLIGTHSLIQDRVEFNALALAIIDEQHRFGVVQRAKLRKKGPAEKAPHLLVMTATPIPRTLALTLYGDLDVSIIDELPPGRTPIKTELVREAKRHDLYAKMRKQLGEGRQVYVVYPLIEESEKMDLKDATQMAGQLATDFPEYVVDLLHGRMSAEEKERVMRRFAAREAHLLVSTTVIEVGIDIPNATVMVIEHAERFGLSQLHQLRGRVGRGAHQSFCYLVSGFVGEEAYHRLSVLRDSSDGFKIAEEDLAIRGPGDFIGTRQAGLPELGVANLARDQDLLIEAKSAAEDLLSADAELAQYPQLKQKVAQVFRHAQQLALSG